MKSRPERFRRTIALLALLVATVASAATSPAVQETRIAGPVVTGSLTVDSEHPIAVQLLTVSLNDVASATPGKGSIEVSRDGQASVRLTVVPVVIGLETGQVEARPFDPTGSAGALEVSAGATETFEVDCTTQTPCDRMFRVIAQQTGTAAATVSWTVSGSLSYQGVVWPSGAAMDIRVDQSVAIGGAGRSQSAGIPSQRIVLDATRPAAVRLVEVRLAAAAVPANMSDVVTTAVLDATVPGGDVTNPYYGVSFRQISPTPTVSARVPGLPQFDPFGDCLAGSDCVRTYLLTARWFGDKPETIDWDVQVSQIRLRGQPAPAGSLQVQVLSSYDITNDPPQRLHLEGDLQITPGDGSLREAKTSLYIAVEEIDASPRWPVPSDLVPVPGIVRFSTSTLSGTTIDSKDVLYHQLSSSFMPYVSTDVTGPLVAAPFGDEHPNGSSPLRFEVMVGVNQEQAALSEPITVHWTLDFDIYGYEALPQLQAMSVPAFTPSPPSNPRV